VYVGFYRRPFLISRTASRNFSEGGYYPMNIPADEDDNEETYGDFLERTGIEDTEQHYQMFISGGYTDDDYE
jgi:hypothetical protein